MKPTWDDSIFNMAAVSVVCILLLSLIGALNGDVTSIFVCLGCVVVITLYVIYKRSLNRILRGQL